MITDEQMRALKVGDIIIMEYRAISSKPLYATVVEGGSSSRPALCFEEEHRYFHSCNGLVKSGHGYYFSREAQRYSRLAPLKDQIQKLWEGALL